MSEEYKTHLVSGILRRDDKVLLAYRINTKVYANYWSLPVGHVETGESGRRAIDRELAEELAIEVTKATPLRQLIDKEQSIFHQVYLIEKWWGDVKNNETEFCGEIRWCRLNDLPSPITPVTGLILKE
ncbi:MAG: NUDIX domain-containing protein [Kangiellaceae bacterium]|nr:NUDIX domain-containing protein [Kangiellaceae bacterium]